MVQKRITMFNAEEVLKKYAPKIEEDEQISMPEIIDKVGKSKEPILENAKLNYEWKESDEETILF